MFLSLRTFINDETGNATSDYAIVMTAFALAMLGTSVMITNAAGRQMTFTFTGLDNRNGVTP